MSYQVVSIDGNTFKEAARLTGAPVTTKGIKRSSRVDLELKQNMYLLGAEYVYGFPVLTDNGVFLTVHDFGENPKIIGFSGLNFSMNALIGGLNYLVDLKKANQAEREVGELDHTLPDHASRICRIACYWGGGSRVWGNLVSLNGENKLGGKISAWLQAAESADTAVRAIEGGAKIKGLGVSFASKHLRLMWPTRYGVLDSFLSEELGYARNPAGYGLFIRDLAFLEKEQQTGLRVCDLESGIYSLVAQMVRIKRGTSGTKDG